MTETVSTAELGRRISVHPKTILKWRSAGHITPVEGGPTTGYRWSVDGVKAEIRKIHDPRPPRSIMGRWPPPTIH